MLHNQLVQFGRDVLRLPDWSAQNLEILLRPWPGNITFPHSGLGIDLHGCTLHLLTSWRAFTCSVPHLCLAQVQRDACMDPQLPLQQLVNVPHPVRAADDMDVVKERKQLLVLLQLLRNGHQRTICPKLSNIGIVASPCSPPSPCWMSWTTPSSFPQTRGRTTKKGTDEGQELCTILHVTET